MKDEAIPGLDGDGPRWPRALRHATILAGLLALWEFVTAFGYADPLLFPRPSAIFTSFVPLYITRAFVWEHLWVTMTTVLAGFVVGTAVGIFLAVIAGLSETVHRYTKPYVIVLEATPRIAIGPLMLAWLGFGFGAKLAIVTLVCFFAPFVNTLTAILSANPAQVELLRSLGASKWQTLTKAIVPDAMPMIMAGVRLAMASALGGALVAEFISSNRGMGVLLDNLSAALDMPAAFATLLSLTVIGFVLYALMEWIEGRVIFWQNDAGMRRVSTRRKRAWGLA
ncbi:MAG: ABC transporter permease [Pseudomonadales bacterium]|jgi:NitT/TauT family transport system permease protein